jgi:Mg/Co/Ni transporter MgtE
MILEQIDKYLKQAEIVNTVNTIGRADIDELVEYVMECSNAEKSRILSMLDINKRVEIEKLIEGSII